MEGGSKRKRYLFFLSFQEIKMAFQEYIPGERCSFKRLLERGIYSSPSELLALSKGW